MFCMRDLGSLGREELIQIILDQHRLIEQLRADVEQLKKRGSAAPFSKGTRKKNPKAPGRKPGQGCFRFRKEPANRRKGLLASAMASCGNRCGGRR